MHPVTNSEAYRQQVRNLSDRICEAQKPIRILDAVMWDTPVQEAFFAAGAGSQPAIDADYYRNRPLGFDAADKRAEFHAIERDIVKALGLYNPVGRIMRRMCQEYRLVVRMLEQRGTPEFSDVSRELYGSSGDAFHAGEPTLADLGVMMSDTLAGLGDALPQEAADIPGDRAVAELQGRMDAVFREHAGDVQVRLSDGIVADAAAGSDYIKIRQNALFTARDLRALEVHEGWVHLGTTLNGKNQPVCTFLSKGPPSATVTQEGLAILMELITMSSHPARLRRVTNRIRAVEMAENGATFLDVYRFYIDEGIEANDAFFIASRVFRGSTPTLGPFTKDLTYSKGFVLVYHYMLLAVRKGLIDRIPLLFCGKTTLEDMGAIAQLTAEGLIERPVFLPPPIRDLNAVVAWMCYSNFLSRLTIERVEADYERMMG